jgi:protein-S-isoprenylcysteine O-methyltransferase Ste14
MPKIIPPFLFFFGLAAMLLLDRFWPVAFFLPKPYNWLGILPLIAGLTLGLLGFLTFRRARTTLNTFGEPGTLVTGGVFRLSRNPMYLGFALMLLGVWLLLGTCSPLIGLVLFVLVADRWYIRFEERRLTAKFGSQFNQYRASTRRWI